MDELKRILLNAGIKNSLFEGTWSAPQTEKQALELQQLMKDPIPAEDAAGMIYHLIGDDDLFDKIGEVEDKDGPDVDVRYLVAHKLKDWMDEKIANANWQKPWDPKALDIVKNLAAKYWKLNENQSGEMTLDEARFIIKASRDWLDRKRQLENFKITSNRKADYQRRENIEEEMAYIRKLLERDKMQFGYKTVNDMFQAAKQMVLGAKESTITNQSPISEQIWQVSKLPFVKDMYGDPLMAQKLTRKGVNFYITADPENPYDPRADYVGWVGNKEIIRSKEISNVKRALLSRAKELTSESNIVDQLSEIAYEKSLDPNQPVIVQGVKGLKSKDFTKRFKNMSSYEKWLNKFGDDVEVQYITNEKIENDELTLKEEYKKFKEELAFKEFEKALEEFGVGAFDPRSNKTADVGPNTLKKMAARLGHKISKGGVPPRISKNSFKKEK